MQIGYKWLSELVDFDWDAEELCDRLTMAGVACEVAGPVFEKFSGVVVGKVKTVKPHPSSDKLKICEVDSGIKTVITVCGAPNVKVGMKSAFAAIGAVLPGGLEITPVDKSGVKSEGMLCSEKELGLSDDGSVIMQIDKSYKIGSDLWEKMDLDEPLILFELTPNRPDCMSVIGVAREIAALAGTKMRKPEFELKEIEKEASELVKIDIEDSVACPRYAARIIENVKIAPSPFWLKRKLVSAGVRPINNVVDITNLVLMEYGQPLHAFDYKLFSRPQVFVRLAKPKEKFVTLDEEERILESDDILITDSTTAVALGGIMGGLNTEVHDDTRTILLESAHFRSTNICRTRKRLGMASESSIRFEKGADPNIVGEACDYAAWLLFEYAGGKVLHGLVDCYPKVIEPVEVELRPARVNQILATDITAPQMIDILSSLEFGVQTGKMVSVSVPTFRPDCTREIDLIEEIGRIYGYDKIGTDLRASGNLLTERKLQEIVLAKIRENLTLQGLYEILTVNMVDPEKIKKIGLPDNYVALLNPLSNDLAVYRTNLLVNMLQVISHNLNRKQTDIELFEIGNVAYKDGASHYEETHLGCAVCGVPKVRNWSMPASSYDFFDLKGILQDFCCILRLGELNLKQREYPFFDGTLSFDIYFNDHHIGYAGQVSNNASEVFDIESPVFYFEIIIDKVIGLYNQEIIYEKLPKYPSVLRDIAVIVEKSVFADKLMATIRESAEQYLVAVDLFDIYTGKQVEKDMKSLAFNLEFRSDEKTLTDEEIEPILNNIVSQLQTNFNARLRT